MDRRLAEQGFKRNEDKTKTVLNFNGLGAHGQIRKARKRETRVQGEAVRAARYLGPVLGGDFNFGRE
eukprot:3973081-Lingulodinium_polyedra.AAC.1